jgi:RimJ/RimL family protein N-acetyltransferase
MRLMDRAAPVTQAEHDAWFESLGRRDDCAYFAVEVRSAAGAASGPGGTTGAGRHVGNVWFWAIDRRHRKAEVRVVIGDPDARGAGVGSEAIDQLCRLGFERLDLHRVYAYVLDINPAARRAFERAGFTVEGTLRDDRWTGERFTDAYLLARVKSG